MGAGEAPGVWRGAWAATLGLDGVVDADELRALVNGRDPSERGRSAGGASGADGPGDRRDVVGARSRCRCCGRFGTPETSAAVSIAVVEATDTALAFLEERAAVARQQQGGVRRRVATDGFAVATFAHRTSPGRRPAAAHPLPDPERRAPRGRRAVAFDANPLHVWAKASGHRVPERARTAPDRTARGRVGARTQRLPGDGRLHPRATPRVLEAHRRRSRPTSKPRASWRSTSKRDRMRADDRASLATRQHKDKTLTPERLRDRWHVEANAVGLEPGAGVDDLVVGRRLDPDVRAGRCRRVRGAGRPGDRACARPTPGSAKPTSWSASPPSPLGGSPLDEIVAALPIGSSPPSWSCASPPTRTRRRPPEWSTVELRAVEDRLLADVHQLTAPPAMRRRRGARRRGDRGRADRWAPTRPTRCTSSAARARRVRRLVAPAGLGKTTALHAAVTAQHDAGRTRGRRRADPQGRRRTPRRRPRRPDHRPLPPPAPGPADTSRHDRDRATRRHRSAPATPPPSSTPSPPTPGAQLWCVGDARQAQAGRGRRPRHRTRTPRRRRRDPRRDPAREPPPTRPRRPARPRRASAPATSTTSQAIRTEHGWEHEHATPADTRQALAARRGRRRRPPRRRPGRGPRGQPRRLRRPRRPHPRPARRPRRAPRPHPPGPGLGTRPPRLRGRRPHPRPRQPRPRPDRQVSQRRHRHHPRRHPTAPTCSSTTAASLPAREVDRRVAGPTAPRTCRTPGPAPSTAPKAAPGARSTSSAPPRSTDTPATSARAADNYPPTPGTPAPTPTTPPVSSPTSAPPAKPSLDAMRRAEPKTLAAHRRPLDPRPRTPHRTRRHAALSPPDRPTVRAELDEHTRLARADRDEHRWAAQGLARPRSTNAPGSAPSPGYAAADATTSPAPTKPSPGAPAPQPHSDANSTPPRPTSRTLEEAVAARVAGTTNTAGGSTASPRSTTRSPTTGPTSPSVPSAPTTPSRSVPTRSATPCHLRQRPSTSNATHAAHHHEQRSDVRGARGSSA